MAARRLSLSSLFHTKAKDVASSPAPSAPAVDALAWPWPSGKRPRARPLQSTLPPAGAKTLAAIFLDSGESSFTNSSARHDCSSSLSTASVASAECDTAADDAIVRGLIRPSDRILFDPAGASATSSILEVKPAAASREEAFAGGLAVAFESEDPYEDFRASMEEMVTAHGVRGWGWLEEMLGWYLRANGEGTHGAIVAAFIDVIVAIADPAGDSSSSSPSSSCTVTDED